LTVLEVVPVPAEYLEDHFTSEWQDYEEDQTTDN